MLFTTLSALGLVAAATAAPHLHSVKARNVETREAIQHAERGLTWTPRSIQRRNRFGNSYDNFDGSFNNNVLIQSETITILEDSSAEQQLEQEQLQLEIQLTQAIQQEILAQQELSFAIDNIRSNTFNNLNSNVNTIAVVVTTVVDSRDSSSSNNRYLVRQLQSNPSATEQVFIQINDQASLTIANNIPSSVLQAAQASGTGFAPPNLGSYTPGGSISLQASGINLLPYGAALPSFSNAQVFNDPAIIIQENQQVFVQNSENSQLYNVVAALQAEGLANEIIDTALNGKK